jgi:hypothetical protein
VYDEDDCTIEEEMQVTGSNLNGIYKLDMAQEMAHVAATDNKMHRLWQRLRLGHLCRKSMKVVVRGMATVRDFSDTDNEPCTSCTKGKHSKVVSKSSKNRAMQKLELIHSDV